MFDYQFTHHRIANLESILGLWACDKYSGVKPSVIDDLASVGCPIGIGLDSGFRIDLELVRDCKATASGVVKARYRGKVTFLVPTIDSGFYPVSFDARILIDYCNQTATFSHGLPMFDGKEYPHTHLHDAEPTIHELLYVVGADSNYLLNRISKNENLQRIRESWIHRFDSERCR
jgi:hypothetical protein